MKAKLLRVAGKIRRGTDVEIGPGTGTNELRSQKDLGGHSTIPSPVFEVTDDQGNAENVDTRDLKPNQ